MTRLSQSTRLFKALMHPTRLSILHILQDGEQCVCHLEAMLGLRQAYISQHLMVLREAGLVEDRRDGARIYYRVVKPEVYTLVETVKNLSGEGTTQVVPKESKKCPCPKCNQVIGGDVKKVGVTP